MIKKNFQKFWNWRHRNLLLSFLSGLLIAFLIMFFLNNVKEENIKKEIQDKEIVIQSLISDNTALRSQIKDVKKLSAERDSLNTLVKDMKNQEVEKINKIRKQLRNEIKKFNNYTDAQLQQFISEWARKNGHYE